MPVNASDVTNLATELLNYSDGGLGYGVVQAGGRLKGTEATKLVLFLDESVCRLFLQLKGHPRRGPFLTNTQTLDDGELLDTSVGAPEKFQFQVTGGTNAGTWAAIEKGMDYLAELEAEIRNPLALKAVSQIKPHLIVDGVTVRHNAAGLLKDTSVAAVAVTGLLPVFTPSGSCQAPTEFTMAEVYAFVATEMSKDGARISGAAHYKSLYQMEMASLGVPNAPIPRMEGS